MNLHNLKYAPNLPKLFKTFDSWVGQKVVQSADDYLQNLVVMCVLEEKDEYRCTEDWAFMEELTDSQRRETFRERLEAWQETKDILQTIGDGALTAQQISESIILPIDATATILSWMEALGLLSLKDGKYQANDEDFTGISAHSVVYSVMDDFSGNYLVGSVHPDHTTNVMGGKVLVKKFSQIGMNCVIFPKLTIEEGTAIGACSLVRNNREAWSIYFGVPASMKASRNKNMLNFAY